MVGTDSKINFMKAKALLFTQAVTYNPKQTVQLNVNLKISIQAL